MKKITLLVPDGVKDVVAIFEIKGKSGYMKSINIIVPHGSKETYRLTVAGNVGIDGTSSFEKNVSERGGRKWRSTSEIPGYLQWSDSFEKGGSK